MNRGRNVKGIASHKLNRMLKKVEALEEHMSEQTDNELRDYIKLFKKRIATGDSVDNFIDEVFAVGREACYRVLGMKPYWNQILAGLCLHQGRIIEMKTGEGKTLTEVCPAIANSLGETSTHIATVNSYLSVRDMMQMQQVFNFLGLTVGIITEKHGQLKNLEYASDVVYGVNSEFGFDFLRDNKVFNIDNKVQTRKGFLIVDEMDSVLIDDGNTPLLIAIQGTSYSEDLHSINKFVKSLQDVEDYDLDTKQKSIILTEKGRDKAEKYFGFGEGFDNYLEDVISSNYLLHINNALRAEYIMHKDADYIVDIDETSGQLGIVLIDQSTGRRADGRRFSEGLHCALEAKEGLAVNPDDITSAQVTYRNYLTTYKKVSGMSGTIATEREEFQEYYFLDIAEIPTNKEPKRLDCDMRVFKRKEDKYVELVKEIALLHRIGRPVLIGTNSIPELEEVSELLTKHQLPHNCLSASNLIEEAKIISKAGQRGAITIATPIAGRGTDIKIPKDVNELGGLFVFATSLSTSVRIDNQLKGRAGRQGDNGTSQIFVSYEDKVIKDYLDLSYDYIMEHEIPEGELTKRTYIEEVKEIQEVTESMQLQSRKHMNHLGDVLWNHQMSLYIERDAVLKGIKNIGYKYSTSPELRVNYKEDGFSVFSYIYNKVYDTVESVVKTVCGKKTSITDDEKLRIVKEISGDYHLTKEFYLDERDILDCIDTEELIDLIADEMMSKIHAMDSSIDDFEFLACRELLSSIDNGMIHHIRAMSSEEKANGYAQFNQRNPVVRHSEMGDRLFERTLSYIQDSYIKRLFALEVNN